MESSAVPQPDVFWYRLNGMDAQKNAPKKVLVALFSYIFHVKTKSNIAYPSPNALNIKYFWTLSYNHWEFLSITKLSNPYFKENGMPKKCLDAALKSLLL